MAQIDDDRAFLNSLSEHSDRLGDTSNMNPAFASSLAAAIRDARSMGLPVGLMSGFREGNVTGSKYDMGGNSSHTYGLAADISGLDGPNGKITQAWAKIAAAHGLNNPYGVGNKAEFNHWQLPPQPLEQTPNTLAALKAAKASGDMGKVWNVYGTMINAANAPVPGALADQGPESVGSSGPAAASSGPLDTRQLVFNKLTAAGLAPHQALGAVWSLAGESGKGLNPNAYNPNDPGGAVGIGQWNQERRTALENFAKTRGTAVTDPATQADFLVDELTNKDAPTYQPGVFAKMQKAGSAEDATRTWTTQFERPQKDNSDARIKNGANVASLDANGNFVLGQGGGGGTAAPATTGAAVAAAPAAKPDQSWASQAWSKLTGTPVDAQGNPIANAQSPLQQFTQAANARLLAEGQTPAEEAPIKSALSAQGPGARNVSPGLANVSQTYGQTLNSFSQPLQWTSTPLQGAGMPAAGLQRVAGAPVHGMTLNSLQPPPGIDPNLGYGVSGVGYG